MNQRTQNKKALSTIRKINRRKLPIVSAFLTLLILCVVLFSNRIYNTFFNLNNKTDFTSDAPDECSLAVTFLDVGQGNCVLIESGGHYMLIDGGTNDKSSFVVSYLKNKGITKLDYVIISHYDADHLSGTIGAMYNFEVGTLLSPDYETDTKIYRSYLTCIDKQNISPVHPSVGDYFTLGKSEFEVVCPDKYTFDNENDNSIGIRIHDDYHSFLILGDAAKESEKAMISSGMNLSSDVYMVSHHGSKSSTSAAFLDYVSPTYAVISVGAGNSYGHPSDTILKRIESRNIETFRTDLNGTITAYSTPDNIKWSLEKAP